MSGLNDIEELIIRRQRRLQKLKEQQAIEGISTDPKVLIEIEDIEAEIEKLQVELTSLEKGPILSTKPIFTSQSTRLSITSRQVDKTTLRKAIVAQYSLEQVKTLCEDCDVDYDELGQVAKDPLVRELIREMERRGKLALLEERVKHGS